MQTYDLIIIGSGPAGQRAAIQGAKLGKRVAVVEKREVVGGACINTGTIPSKSMREAVMHLSGYQYQSIYGLNYRVKENITIADLSFRVQHVIKTEIDVTQAQLSRNEVEMLTGAASFIDPTHLLVVNSRGQSELEAHNIIIATGTKPAISPTVPINGRTIISSDQILDIQEIPKTLCYHLRDSRVTLRLNESVESVEETPEGAVVANLESKKRISGDMLLYAVGRQGNVEELNLAAAGLEADSRGRIAVDSDYRTRVPHIYAVG